MADPRNPALDSAPRPGGFFRIAALSGRPEDDRYVDSEGRDVPEEEVSRMKSEQEERSRVAENLARSAPTGAAVSPMTGSGATNQQPVVETTDRNVGTPPTAGATAPVRPPEGAPEGGTTER